MRPEDFRSIPAELRIQEGKKAMCRLIGVAASPGVGIGRLAHFTAESDLMAVSATEGSDRDDEQDRFQEALAATLTDLEERIAEAKDAGRKSLLLLVRRSGEPRFVALSLEES